MFVYNHSGRLVYSMEIMMNEISERDPAIKDITLILTCSQDSSKPPADASRHRLILDSDKGIICLDFMDTINGKFEVGRICPAVNGTVTSIKQEDYDDGLNGPLFKYFIDIQPFSVSNL